MMLVVRRTTALFDQLVIRHLTEVINNWLLATQGFTLLSQIVKSLKGFTWVAIPQLPILYQTYKSPEDVEAYWKASEAANKRLRASNATHAPHGLSLISYYTPKLLPFYRESPTEDPEAKEEYISSRTFCKWHRMVHPDPLRPTPKEAEHLIKHFSARDRREMKRIARLETDRAVFREDRVWTPQYRHEWKTWLETKGPDTAIVFTEDII